MNLRAVILTSMFVLSILAVSIVFIKDSYKKEIPQHQIQQPEKEFDGLVPKGTYVYYKDDENWYKSNMYTTDHFGFKIQSRFSYKNKKLIIVKLLGKTPSIEVFLESDLIFY